MQSRITDTEIEQILREKLDVKEIIITDLKGGNHWQVEITAPDFNGLNRVKQQQLIYKILAEPLASEAIHALVIKCKDTLS